jgi:MscS family membrane protein
MDINLIITYIKDNVYVQSLIIFFAFFIISKIALYISEKVFLKLAKKTKTDVDNLIVEKTSKPSSLLLLLIGMRLALIPLPLQEKVLTYLSRFIYSMIVVVVGYLVIKVFDIIIGEWGKGLAKKTKTSVDDTIISLLHKVAQIIMVILVFLFILDGWGIEIGPLLASLGVAGIAVAFALQSTIANIFGGVALILDKTIKKGDIVKLDAGASGKVYDVGIRSTKVKTWDNEIITIPNGKLVESNVHNVTLPDPSIRINIEFGVAYGSNIEKVKKLAMDTALSCKDTLKDPAPRVLFLNMADSALQFKLMFWVDEISKKWDTHQHVITNLYDNLNKKKIGIPFPQMDVHLKKK